MSGALLRRAGGASVVMAGALVVVGLASGTLTLVTTHGVSMLPRFHSGDLAVLLASPQYHVGEIVGYYSPLLRITVLHRIVAEQGGLFTFKGDHNAWLDPTRLPASAIRGRLWLHVPHAGTVLGWVRSPLAIGGLAFGSVTLGLFDGVSRRRRARARHAMGAVGRFDMVAMSTPLLQRRAPFTRPQPSAAPQPSVAAPTPRPGSPHTRGTRRGGVEGAWAAVGVPLALCALCVAGAAVAWSRPTTKPSYETAPFSEGVVFSYSAPVAPGVAYPTGAVSSGDPVFLHLVPLLHLQAHYTLTPPPGRSATFSGTLSAEVTLSGPDGWSYVLAHGTPVAVTDTSGMPSASIDVPVDLAQITALRNSFTTETGMSLEPAQVVLSVRAVVHGTVAGMPVDRIFTPTVALQLAGQELSLNSASAPGAPPSYPQLSASHADSVQLVTRSATTVRVLGRKMSVSAARPLSLVGAVAALAAAFLGALWGARRRRMDDAARLRAVHRYNLVPVTTSPATPDRHIIDVESPQALGRLAGRYDCVILELRHDRGRTYYVECGATVYRFGTEPVPPTTQTSLGMAGHQDGSPVLVPSGAPGRPGDRLG